MSSINHLFEIDNSLRSDTRVSKVKGNREYLISNQVADELNTYLSFSPFRMFNDTYPVDCSKDSKDPEKRDPKVGTPGVRSLFNASGAVAVGTGTGRVSTEDILTGEASEWRLSNNVPLMDNRATRRALKTNYDCSIHGLVQASRKGLLGRSMYAYSDFMYCKHLGKVSNNYMITLRRFPLPVDDYISSIGTTSRKNKDVKSKNSLPIGCLVTWMGTPGNEMQNLLKYSYKLPFKQMQAKWEDAGGGGDSQGGIANGLAGMFDPTYRQQYMSGHAGAAANNVMKTFFHVDAGAPPYAGHSHIDQNKAYGPVDAVKMTYIRSEDGIQFEQKFSITFDYELRSYNGINGRQAMLDLLTNILNVTYSTGTFWGGGYRGSGAHQNNIFANMEIFKCKGGFTDFADAFAKDLTTITDKFRSNLQQKHGGDWMSMIKSALNQLGGMLIAGQLNKLGRPAKGGANSLLSPAPVGFWHLTIGNPHHPIMSVGNLILTNTTLEHYGPLGLDDFPTGIRVTCELTNGKGRDIRDIEKIYMHGNDRIYSSMGQKVFDMYKHSKEYRSVKDKRYEVYTADGDVSTEIMVGKGKDEKLSIDISADELQKMGSIMQKYFGTADTYGIYVTATEQEYGAHKKRKAEPDKESKGGGKGGGNNDEYVIK